MGHFLTVTAIRDRPVDAVAEAIRSLAEQCGASVEEVQPAEVIPEEDTSVFAPQNGWTVVRWPSFAPDVWQELSQSLETLVSSVSVIDDDYWFHELAENGTLLDGFSSDPEAMATSPEEEERARREWMGDAEVIAARCGVPPDTIRPYLVPDASLPEPRRAKKGLAAFLQWAGVTSQEDYYESERIKAFPDDEFALGNFWVFVDLWRRMGITYPDVEQPEARVLRFPIERVLRFPIERVQG